jgi:hypothetical protein
MFCACDCHHGVHSRFYHPHFHQHYYPVPMEPRVEERPRREISAEALEARIARLEAELRELRGQAESEAWGAD